MNEQQYVVIPPRESEFWKSFGYPYAGLVYCPMCEVTHENNTNCQRND
jgi:hypothetical protein